MKLKLIRKYCNETYTIGKLYIDGEYYCDTLEDTVRDLTKEAKVYSQTAIPSGIYKVVVTMSNKFKRLLPLLLNVPYFTGIRIHRGNTANDSAGCILLGENKVKGKVINSTHYEIDLTNKLLSAQNNNEEITIEIV